ncbi:MAG TPA: hypothetical protein VHJ82_10185 [Actinomycetota bacterium]|nr:hypothetical protein [Actinomycetota bacterium]
MSQGRSIEEARTNLTQALGLYFEDHPLPTDISPPIIVTLEVEPRAENDR